MFKNDSECVSSPVVLLYTSPGLVEEQDPAGGLEHHPEHVHGVEGEGGNSTNLLTTPARLHLV